MARRRRGLRSPSSYADGGARCTRRRSRLVRASWSGARSRAARTGSGGVARRSSAPALPTSALPWRVPWPGRWGSGVLRRAGCGRSPVQGLCGAPSIRTGIGPFTEGPSPGSLRIRLHAAKTGAILGGLAASCARGTARMRRAPADARVYEGVVGEPCRLLHDAVSDTAESTRTPSCQDEPPARPARARAATGAHHASGGPKESRG